MGHGSWGMCPSCQLLGPRDIGVVLIIFPNCDRSPAFGGWRVGVLGPATESIEAVSTCDTEVLSQDLSPFPTKSRTPRCLLPLHRALTHPLASTLPVCIHFSFFFLLTSSFSAQSSTIEGAPWRTTDHHNTSMAWQGQDGTTLNR